MGWWWACFPGLGRGGGDGWDLVTYPEALFELVSYQCDHDAL